MKQSLADVFSYLKIEFSEQDSAYFLQHSLYADELEKKRNDSEISNSAEDFFAQIEMNNMVCNAKGALCITISVPRILSAEQILFLENKLEQSYSIPQVIIKQIPRTEVSLTEQKLFLLSAEPWIKKHADLTDHLAGRLLAKGELTVKDNNPIWQLDSAHLDIVQENGNNWLDDFWQSYGCISCEFDLEAVESEFSTEEKIEITEQLFNDAIVEATELYNHEIEHIKKFQNNKKKAETSKLTQNTYRRKHRKSDKILWGKTGPPIPLIKINEINNETDRAMFEGQVFMFETKITRNNRLLVKFAITDLTTSISCTIFADPEAEDELTEIIKDKYIRVTAGIYYDDRYEKDFVGKVTCIEKAQKPETRKDNSPKKRVELHIHSKMSAKDGTINPKDIVKTAFDFGHSAVAITDHGVMQGFPEICNMAEKLQRDGKPFKVIYGVEGYLLDDGFECIAYEVEGKDLSEGFVVIKIHTTTAEPESNAIRFIEALKLRPVNLSKHEFEIVDKFEYFIDADSNPLEPANVNNHAVPKVEQSIAPTGSELDVMRKLEMFLGCLPVIAVDALKQLNYLRYAGFNVAGTEPRIKFNPPLIEFGLLAHAISKKLSKKPQYLIEMDTDDLYSIAQIFPKLIAESGITDLIELNNLVDWQSFEQLKEKHKKTNHIVLLAKDLLGLYNLYRLCSDSHLKYFYYSPRIPRSVLNYYGAGIIKGMACVDGEIFDAILQLFNECQGDFELTRQKLHNSDLLKLANQYDYLEIQPLTNNSFLMRDANTYVQSTIDLQNLNKLVIELGEITDKLVCATCDAHFLNPEDAIYRKILMTNMNFEDMEEMADLYFRTTDEMLDEFSYLGEELAYQVVVENPNLIADTVDEGIRPFPKGSFPPLIKSADENVKKLTMEEAYRVYGYNGVLPEIVEKRINHELNSIIDNGFAVMYYIAHCVVKKSNQDGFLVGSRGSVGSSLVATFCGITEVNPLQPHYVCPKCKYAEFDNSGNYGSGFDLPQKKCPHCGTDMKRDGQDIPFETFLGFAGDKQPDIDLNFSGFYQAKAHQFIEEMFGASQTFRAGTISSYAERNSAGMVLKYYEENEMPVSSTEVTRLAQGLQGVKATTGQHPGGIVIVPKERDIFDFTPIQYPANKKESGVITTHFDFHSLDETILKLDILGHDDPSMLKVLSDMTGINATEIPIPDEKVMSLFYSTEALGIPDEDSTIKSATIGLPELGTMLVRNMIAETKPTKFYDLVQISGLSHGTDVWTGNAQELIRNGTCTIDEVIGCRDSIMTYLIYRGLPKKSSFDIMERVRKGRGLSQEQEALMLEHNIPQWYIDSCKKIKYMFPKAHAVAYIVSALRIAWYKVYYPEAYYCAYFTIRADEFSSEELCLPANEIRIKRAEQRNNWNQLTPQEQKRHFYLELVEEMQQRGIDFLPIDLKESNATEFYSPSKGKIRPPFNAIPNISETLSNQIVKARETGGDFKNREDLARRAELGAASIESLAKSGVLDNLAESAQIDFFSMFSE
ncbi:MAG TPA: PolC-type DNA polymerase III [Clostridiaceae bacterium]|nr:PolC-type DNA polymerase III [Clostridiaceae bacterium]